MTPSRFVFAFAVSLLLANAAIAQDKKANKLPELAQTIFDKAESFELYSLQPELEKNEKPAETLQGWKVLGKTVLKGAGVPKDVRDAVNQGIAKSDSEGAKCFEPRHALRATYEGKTVDLVICFECSWVYVYYGKEPTRQAVVTVARDAQTVLDATLKLAGVPLPK